MLYHRDCIKDNSFSFPSKVIFHEDELIYNNIRVNIDDFIARTISQHNNCDILEICPSGSVFAKTSNRIDTIDIVSNGNKAYVADFTKTYNLPKNHYDVIYCLEVLGQCSNPNEMLQQLRESLRENGVIYISNPFQFRIQGQLLDYGRLSEYKLKSLAEECGFEVNELSALTNSSMPTSPLHYTMICHKIVLDRKDLCMLCKVSFGEMVDKLTILEIKKEYITDKLKHIEIVKEYEYLYDRIKVLLPNIIVLHDQLKSINHEIWRNMDNIRVIKSGTVEWVDCCQKTIIDNDRRFRVKNHIDAILGSDIKEQKGYSTKNALILLPDNSEHLNNVLRYLSTYYDQLIIYQNSRKYSLNEHWYRYVEQYDEKMFHSDDI